MEKEEEEEVEIPTAIEREKKSGSHTQYTFESQCPLSYYNRCK